MPFVESIWLSTSMPIEFLLFLLFAYYLHLGYIFYSHVVGKFSWRKILHGGTKSDEGDF